MNFRKKSRTRRNSNSYLQEPIGKWRNPMRRMSRYSSTFSEHDDDSDEVDEEDEDSKQNGVINWAEEFFGRRSLTEPTADLQDIEVHLTEKQTLILSTLVPDEILLLDKFDTGEPRRFVGVLMMADVSGYTALSERYNSFGKGGSYRLTVTLNTYLGALTEIIYSHGGDIIKFAGDAFLALWKTDKKSFLSHTIHSVIACALVIQHSYAKYETDVKVNLRVKLAISAGNLLFSPIGVGIDKNFVIFGLPVIEAKLAESVCLSGEVKVASNAWAHCYSRNYDHLVENDGHVTVKSILYDPNEKDVLKPYLGFSNLLRQVKATNRNLDNLPDFIWESSKKLNPAELTKKNDVLSLRKAILKAEKKNLGSTIRNFMIRPVLTQIDAHQPLEYLTEMRQVSILFVTLKPRDCPPAQLITIVNNSYQITCEIVYKSMGCVNKIILFDKDVMILVVFGLRGFKHESEAQAALKCAYGVRKSVSALDGVLEVSIGVTTGQVYCGVVGHPLRREFTVIGAIVNKAARLMCSFRNKISCDEATFVKSKMSKNGFTLLPPIELKGIVSPGKIYEYSEDIRVKKFKNIPMIPPLLDRLDETAYFKSWIMDSIISREIDSLLLIGESRIGKTRILEWFTRISVNLGYKVCHISLTSIHSANPYLALSQIVSQMIGLSNEPAYGFVKEQIIVDLLKMYDEDLCYLNNIIKVRFAYHEGAYSLDEKQRQKKAREIFLKLMQSIQEVHVIFMDDLQNLDASSWDYISIMLSQKNIFTVLTVTRGKFSSVHTWLYNVFISPSIRKIILGPLSFEWIPALACQILDVDAVPNDLCNALKSHCKGMPGLVESLIVHLFSNGAIEIHKVTDEKLEEIMKEEELEFPNPYLLKPQALIAEEQETLDQLREEDASGEVSVCIITNKEELNTNFNAHNLDSLIMCQIDSLTPYQQLLLKISSVIGNFVSRTLLENIMYENDPLITAKAIKRLFAMNLFSCASAKNKYYRQKAVSTALISTTHSGAPAKPDKLECVCDFEYDPENSNQLPKYAFCKVMRFRNKSSRQTCYELLPMNQKKEFHSRIVYYLESNKQICTYCGGGLVVFPHIWAVKSDEDNFTQTQSSKVNENPQEFETDYINIRNQVKTSNTKNITAAEEFIKKTIENRNLSSNDTNVSNHKSMENDPLLLTSKRVTISSLLVDDLGIQKPNTDSNVLGMLRNILEAKKISDWDFYGLTDSRDIIEIKDDESVKSFSVCIEKGVSNTDFKKCSCSELNILNYEQLIHHAVQAEMRHKAIEFLIQYCYLCFLSENGQQVEDKLNEAERICYKNLTKEQEEVISKPEMMLYLGRIHTLRAAGALMQCKLLAAKLEIEKALRKYELSFFKGTKLLSVKNKLKFMSKKYAPITRQTKADSVFCLNIASLVYAALGDEKSSRKSALYAIGLVQKVDCRFTDLCDAFTGAIQVELNRGCSEYTLEIERKVKHVMRHLHRPVQKEELYALGKMFLATFNARLSRAELAPGIRAAYRSIVISNFLTAYHVSIIIIPDLFYILLCRYRIEEAIGICQLCLRLNASLPECEIWYYALCMDLILDCGFQLEQPTEIIRFADTVLYRKGTGEARHRLVVNLWTYWLRMDEDRNAKKLEIEAFSWLSREEDSATLTSLLTALRFAESLLESLSRKLDDLRKVVDLMELRSIADRELNNLEKDCRSIRIIYCRWLRLKGNSLGLSGRQTAVTMINQALEESKRIHNRLEESLSRAALTEPRDWQMRARGANFTDWHAAHQLTAASWHHMLYKMSISRR